MIKTLPSEMIYSGQTVKVIKTGYFPDTVIVLLPDGTETQVYVNQLQKKES